MFTLSSEVIEHERCIYTFMNLIGDLGGVHDLFVVFISLFMSPISEHFFISKVLGKLFLVKTSKTNLFKHQTQILKKNGKNLKFNNTKI